MNPTKRFFLASCFQALNGRYVSLEEHEKSKIYLSAENEEEAYVQLSEKQMEDSELTIQQRWSICEVSEETYLKQKQDNN